MKKLLTKIKTVLATLGITLISFSSKVMGLKSQKGINMMQDLYGPPPMQGIYGVPQPESKMDVAIKIVPRLLIAITFIIGIICFIKIRKIDDKTLKKRKIKNTIIIISILVILIVILLLLPRFLKKYG